MALELGDHVWYWNGQISLTPEIPRALWFPGADPDDPHDFHGHGREIYNFVIHADEISRGRPHMRNHEGSFAWLNNNPGNISGHPGGPDFGQYREKFNWHHFLIFPTWADGYDAIAKLLRTDFYTKLSILDAFTKYAPESEGNNPGAYANAVAAALSVPVSTPVGALDDLQMGVMQDKIQEIEGVIPGVSLSWDSDEVPLEISDLLPANARKYSRPRSLQRTGSPFTLDMSAPMDAAGFTQGFGGPNQSGHVPPNWYIQFGMDIGGAEGTAVHAAFDGHITKFQPHRPATDTPKAYGAQIFMRSRNDMLGAFYTHLTDVPAGLGAGTTISRGDYLGRVHRVGDVRPHLHLALVEIIGGMPGGVYKGFDLYTFILALLSSDPSTVVPVQFWQDGTPPEPLWRTRRIGALFPPEVASASPGEASTVGAGETIDAHPAVTSMSG